MIAWFWVQVAVAHETYWKITILMLYIISICIIYINLLNSRAQGWCHIRIKMIPWDELSWHLLLMFVPWGLILCLFPSLIVFQGGKCPCLWRPSVAVLPPNAAAWSLKFCCWQMRAASVWSPMINGNRWTAEYPCVLLSRLRAITQKIAKKECRWPRSKMFFQRQVWRVRDGESTCFKSIKDQWVSALVFSFIVTSNSLVEANSRVI